MKRVSIIGYGGIGAALVRGLANIEGWQLGQVMTRHAVADMAAHTSDIEGFLACPADLIIDAAGPEALRSLGSRALTHAPVWSVGAVALADPAFRAHITEVSRVSNHKLRLFACGMAGMPLDARTLRLTMRGPEITNGWTGSLYEAVALWPDRLNTAVACALQGPGIEATDLVMERAEPGAPNEIELTAQGDGTTWQRKVSFAMDPEAPHPVAQMLLTELSRAGRAWQAI